MTTSAHPLEERLLTPEDTEYEAARLAAVWNKRKPERRPDSILLVRSEGDVVEAVSLARSRGWRMGIRSGGHSWIGNGVRDGGLLLDLSGLNDYTIDTEAQTATAGPGVIGSFLVEQIGQRGLVFPGGHCPSVALGGYLLGAGYGWNSRDLGPACLSVEAVDVVLPSGELVHADDSSHPDLMWAVRGAGPGFFGIVTRFYLRLRPHYDRIVRAAYTFPLNVRDDLLAWSYDVLPSLPTRLEMSVKVGYTAGITGQTASLTLAAFCSDGADAADLLAPAEDFLELGRAIRRVEPVDCTMADLYALSDALTPAGNRYAVDGIWCDGPVADIIDAGRPVLDGLPTPKSFLLWMLWGHFPPSERACWSAQAPLYFSPNAVWDRPDDDLHCERWAHHLPDRLAAISHGTQFADANPADRPDPGLSAANTARLEHLRGRYDPDGLLHTYLTPAESTTQLARSRRPVQ
jgi:FAD/FMN-containing dehydrogenase